MHLQSHLSTSEASVLLLKLLVFRAYFSFKAKMTKRLSEMFILVYIQSINIHGWFEGTKSIYDGHLKPSVQQHKRLALRLALRSHRQDHRALLRGHKRNICSPLDGQVLAASHSCLLLAYFLSISPCHHAATKPIILLLIV